MRAPALCSHHSLHHSCGAGCRSHTTDDQRTTRPLGFATLATSSCSLAWIVPQHRVLHLASVPGRTWHMSTYPNLPPPTHYQRNIARVSNQHYPVGPFL